MTPTEKKIEKATEKLYKAVCEYVELFGGKVLVIGGVQTITFPDDLKKGTYNWSLGIKCTGIPPKKDE